MIYEQAQRVYLSRSKALSIVLPSPEAVAERKTADAAISLLTVNGKSLDKIADEEFRELFGSQQTEDGELGESPFQDYEDKAHIYAMSVERVRVLISNIRYHHREHIRKLSPESFHGAQKPYEKAGKGNRFAKNPAMRETVRLGLNHSGW